MISVVLATLNDEADLAVCLSALVPGVVDGVVSEVVVVDGGSRDGTLAVADHAGCDIINVPGRSRGYRLHVGALRARQGWLLFLEPGSVPADGWTREVAAFIEQVARGARPAAGAAFTLKLDEGGLGPRLAEALSGFRGRVLKVPSGAQGWLVSKTLYLARGGYRDVARHEDVDLIRRHRRAERVTLRTTMVGSAARYRHDGYPAGLARDVGDMLASLVRRVAAAAPADG